MNIENKYGKYCLIQFGQHSLFINLIFFLHCRYLDKEGKLWCQFLSLEKIDDGKADTIVQKVQDVVRKKGIPPQLICGLGTDGAAVMTGKLKINISEGLFTSCLYCCNNQ